MLLSSSNFIANTYLQFTNSFSRLTSVISNLYKLNLFHIQITTKYVYATQRACDRESRYFSIFSRRVSEGKGWGVDEFEGCLAVVFICICAYMYACTYICMCVCACVYVYACASKIVATLIRRICFHHVPCYWIPSCPSLLRWISIFS